MTQTCDRPGADHTGANDEISREGTGFEVDHTPIPDGMKRCTKCGIIKPRNEFSRKRDVADGLQSHCKACRAAYRADKRANAPVARWLRGEINEAPTGLEAWLIGQVDRGGDDACWIWTGPTDGKGYGRASFDGVSVFAHHVALRFWTGSVVPAGMHTDHLCRTPLCCNPIHLEVVTPRENTLRGIGLAAENAVKTHCANGHEFDDENTYFEPGGKRHCRACQRDRDRARYARARRGELTALQKMNRGIFARTITFDAPERSA